MAHASPSNIKKFHSRVFFILDCILGSILNSNAVEDSGYIGWLNQGVYSFIILGNFLWFKIVTT